MELKQYASILWRWMWLILLGALLAAVSAFIASRLTPPVYAASATLLINQPVSDRVTDYTALLTSERLARTYTELLTGRPVLDEVIRTLQLPTTAEELVKRVKVNVVRDTQLIELTAENEDPALAAKLANEIPNVFSRQNEAMQSSRYAASKASLAKELEAMSTQIQQTQAAIDAFGAAGTASAELTRLQVELSQYRQSYASLLQSYENIRVAEAQSISNVVVVGPAQLPSEPVRPRTLLNTALAAVVGLMLAVGVVFLIEYLDDSIRSTEQASQALQLPVIGVIARMPNGAARSRLIAASEPRSPVAEAFRSLRTSIQFSSVDRPVRTILVTSPGPAEGKSTVAANLAVVFAQAGLRVVLLDADLRRPSAHKIFGRPNRNGLTDLILQSSGGWDGSFQETGVRSLAMISSGPLPPNPSELLGSQKMAQLLRRLSELSDMIVVDSPPALPVTDALVLAGLCDAVLVVLEAGATHLGSAVQMKTQLEQAGARLAGLVMNKVPTGRGSYYYRYYYYSYDPAGQPAKHGRGWWPWNRRRVRVEPEADESAPPARGQKDRPLPEGLPDQKT